MIRLNLVARSGIIVLQLQNIPPAEMHVFGMGNIIYTKMLLEKIPSNDTKKIANILA